MAIFVFWSILFLSPRVNASETAGTRLAVRESVGIVAIMTKGIPIPVR